MSSDPCVAVDEFYDARYQSGSFSLINAGSGFFACLLFSSRFNRPALNTVSPFH